MFYRVLKNSPKNSLKNLKKLKNLTKQNCFYYCNLADYPLLTYLFLMHPFSTSWNHQKRFSDVLRG